MRRRLEFYKLLLQLLVQHHYRRRVVAPVAVVGRTPHRHQLLVEHLLVPLHYQLVRPHDLTNVILVVECLHHVTQTDILLP